MAADSSLLCSPEMTDTMADEARRPDRRRWESILSAEEVRRCEGRVRRMANETMPLLENSRAAAQRTSFGEHLVSSARSHASRPGHAGPGGSNTTTRAITAVQDGLR